ncbi:MAG: hypothetical protein HJJLKODD_03033 [Phycisphaerae bacterium]|nr:hypothetical protein [Phycisphaerae bacterium]
MNKIRDNKSKAVRSGFLERLQAHQVRQEETGHGSADSATYSECTIPAEFADLPLATDLRQTIEWVAANLVVPPGREDMATCPSQNSYALYDWSRQSARNCDVFWTTIFTKLVPSRSEQENGPRYEDDGRDLTWAFEQIEAAIRSSNSLSSVTESDEALPDVE